MSSAQNMHKEQDPKEKIPVYSINRAVIGEITLRDAITHVEAGEMLLSSKGRGRNRRYTSARWIVIRHRFEDWKTRDSGGYTVWQLVT